MVKAPQHSEQVVAALFGRLEVVSTDWSVQLSSLGANGKLCADYRSPHAAGFVAAVECYRGISGTESLFELYCIYYDLKKIKYSLLYYSRFTMNNRSNFQA